MRPALLRPGGRTGLSQEGAPGHSHPGLHPAWPPVLRHPENGLHAPQDARTLCLLLRLLPGRLQSGAAFSPLRPSVPTQWLTAVGARPPAARPSRGERPQGDGWPDATWSLRLC